MWSVLLWSNLFVHDHQELGPHIHLQHLKIIGQNKLPSCKPLSQRNRQREAEGPPLTSDHMASPYFTPDLPADRLSHSLQTCDGLPLLFLPPYLNAQPGTSWVISYLALSMMCYCLPFLPLPLYLLPPLAAIFNQSISSQQHMDIQGNHLPLPLSQVLYKLPLTPAMS